MNSVVITGASSGIGRQTAITLSEAGYFIILNGRNEERLKETQKQLKNPKHSQMSVADVSTPEGCNTLIQNASEVHKIHPLISLVNNAGIYHQQPFLETSDTTWELQFHTNLMSAIRLIKGLTECLMTVKNSSVVNISSSLGLRSVANTSAYSAVKAAMISLTETLALEMAPKIRVNCVAPGLTHTPIHDFYGKETPELLKKINAAQPMNRMGKPDEIAQAIRYLISDASAWTTGTTLKIDGGIAL